MPTSLTTRHRPETLDGIVGQEGVVKSLRGAIKRGDYHALLFGGPSGTGKTTLARIAAIASGADRMNIIEIDAAKHTGVDDMREISSSLMFQGLGSSPIKFVIIDEAHGLSRQAFDSLLKILEEPPSHVKWALCTTVPAKIPKTVARRCIAYTLKPLPTRDIEDMLLDVAEHDKISTPDEVIFAAARAADGSPGQALANLDKVQDLKTAAEAKKLLEMHEAGADAAELARRLIEGRYKWADYMRLLERMDDVNAEATRIVVLAYVSKAAANAKEQAVPHYLTIMEAFAESYNPTNGKTPLLLSIGRVMFSEPF